MNAVDVVIVKVGYISDQEAEAEIDERMKNLGYKRGVMSYRGSTLLSTAPQVEAYLKAKLSDLQYSDEPGVQVKMMGKQITS